MKLFEKKKAPLAPKAEEPEKIKITVEVKPGSESPRTGKAFEKVAPKEIGKLDMGIAFDTTGSMAAYIEAVRAEVSELIPQLFRDNDDLRLGIVAFGDYCDMPSATEFGRAYQCLMPTDNENDLIRFIKESQDTTGGDGDEFYELVLRKIIDETPWREGATRSVLLISDADPHPLGYSYLDRVVGNQIDWREEGRKASRLGIKIDTVTIHGQDWYRELSVMTNGVSVPFRSGHKTADLVRASVLSKGSRSAREKWDSLYASCEDPELQKVYRSYSKTRFEDTNED